MKKLTRREFCMSAALAVPVAAQTLSTEPVSAMPTPVNSEAILDKGAQLERFHFWQNRDWDWFKANIPFFESPDAELDEIYYYRWEVVTRHLRYTSPEFGYIFTEFLPVSGVTWAGRYGGISASADLQLEEVRWMKNTAPATDYARYFLTVPGAAPRAYGYAPMWCGEALARVHGGSNPCGDLLDAALDNYKAWESGHVKYPNDNGFDAARGLFWNTGRDMGSEYNLASAQLDETLRGIAGYKIRGGAGYRPDINAVMFAEACAITRVAKTAGRTQSAEEFAQKAALLKRNVQHQLWDPERDFFLHRWHHDEYADGDVAGHPSIRAGSLIWETNAVRRGVGHQPSETGDGKGREIFCYHLWRYGLPDDNEESGPGNGYARAWRFLRSPHHFAGQFGLTTAELHDPWFSVIYGECRHNGQSWPFHTARVLAGGANLLNNYKHHQSFSRDDWYGIFRQYAGMHRNANQPFVAESHAPDRPQWTELRPIGFHYFHSSFVDLLITGLIGLRPRLDNILELNPLIPDDWAYFALDDVLYHGHKVSVVWDKAGTRYSLGQGLHVLANGSIIAHSARCERVVVQLPADRKAAAGVKRERNCAVNAEAHPYPKVRASFENPGELAISAVDGSCWFDAEPANRWTTRGSKESDEWFEVEFEAPQWVHRAELSFYEDDYGVEAPSRVVIERWDAGAWRAVALRDSPRARCATVISFASVRTLKVRAKFTNRPHRACGLAQFAVWGT